ncbi:DUF6063 family protein [Anaeromicropila populeti]|uniref:Uncharacterized protein n=1 Tax=Anaeromicropila populeti TaxID=37658 RepID=A0A1I6KAU5_9FIRM|nr:DUF6063 family protein [Anaeromicropila populeti]SFR88010.1 hypothetical protein SAMN05661086_02309 [Anaeromicropila populeti]
MGYELEEIQISQKIFYELLKNRQISEETNKELYYAYMNEDKIMTLVKSQGEAAMSRVERYGNTVYLIPEEDNYVLGFSKKDLKDMLCKSGATDKDYYLSQFVILTILVEFYDGQGSSSLARRFMRVGELQNCISDRLKEGAEQMEVEEQEKTGVAFTNMLEAFEALRSAEGGSKAKTTKEGFLYNILVFLQKQGLIEYIEKDDMIQTTEKLNQFMDWNLLNKNHYNRVLKVLGREIDE